MRCYVHIALSLSLCLSLSLSLSLLVEDRTNRPEHTIAGVHVGAVTSVWWSTGTGLIVALPRCYRAVGKNKRQVTSFLTRPKTDNPISVVSGQKTRFCHQAWARPPLGVVGC